MYLLYGETREKNSMQVFSITFSGIPHTLYGYTSWRPIMVYLHGHPVHPMEYYY